MTIYGRGVRRERLRKRGDDVLNSVIEVHSAVEVGLPVDPKHVDEVAPALVVEAVAIGVRRVFCARALLREGAADDILALTEAG